MSEGGKIFLWIIGIFTFGIVLYQLGVKYLESQMVISKEQKETKLLSIEEKKLEIENNKQVTKSKRWETISNAFSWGKILDWFS